MEILKKLAQVAKTENFWYGVFFVGEGLYIISVIVRWVIGE